ncbi:hypothetical protein ACFLTY_00880 [Chloroflexota bacterium]
MPKELTAEQVRLRCTPKLFNCDSTSELVPKNGIIGQDRALSALKFGLNILRPGFNIYVSGLAGTGRTTVIQSFLEALANRLREFGKAEEKAKGDGGKNSKS